MSPVTLKICKENIHFTAAHFTIFDGSHRERLHGHDYFIKATVTSSICKETGLCFDYAILKKYLKQLARSVDEYFLIPEKSSFLSLQKEEENILIRYQNHLFSIPHQDVKILPITNISNECLAAWFLSELQNLWRPFPPEILSIEIEIENGCGQSISTSWSKA